MLARFAAKPGCNLSIAVELPSSKTAAIHQEAENQQQLSSIHASIACLCNEVQTSQHAAGWECYMHDDACHTLM
jgi:hypothetical protein